MKSIFTLLTILLLQFTAGAQNQPASFHLEKKVNMEALLAPKPSLASGFSTISEARTIIGDIMGAVDQEQNFKVLSTTQVDNAAAVIYQGQRYILYNASFINQLDDAANDRWASISVLAHEIGHHLLGHTLDGRGSQIPKELAADEFSGFALRRMGASLQQAQLAMQLIASPNASASHPGERDRLAAIQTGWNKTNMQSPSNRDVATQNTGGDTRASYPPDQRAGYPRSSYPTDDRNSRNPQPRYPSQQRRYPQQGRSQQGSVSNCPSQRSTQASERIAYEVIFNGANGSRYYITSQNNVVKYNGRQYVSVARLARTNSSTYPYVLYDDQLQLLVDRRGNLRTESGRPVGYIKER
jgi:hypothetical protein